IIKGKMILNDFGKIVNEEWLKTKEIRKNVDLDSYIVMPNHFHGTLIINYNENVGATRWVTQKDDAPTEILIKTDESLKDRAIHRIAHTLISNSLGAIIGQFKSIVTNRVMRIDNNILKSVWQRNYYEHIIRNEMDLFNIRTYIKLNPLKWSWMSTINPNPRSIPFAKIFLLRV
ncbi:MAG: transposase, partial [Ignavibacteriota bacterium]